MKFLNEKLYLEALAGKKPYFFGNVNNDVPTWDEVFFNLEKAVEEQSHIKNLPNYGIITHTGDLHIEKVKYFSEYLKQNLNHSAISAHVYIGLTKYFESFGMHSDDVDVYFWQIIGRTKWCIVDDVDNYEYVLNSGDLIYVPKNIKHQVSSFGPRVGISFGLEKH